MGNQYIPEVERVNEKKEGCTARGCDRPDATLMDKIIAYG